MRALGWRVTNTDTGHQISLAELRPYISVTLGRLRENVRWRGVDSLLNRLEDTLRLTERPGTRKLLQRVDSRKDADLHVGFLHYQEERAPGWSATPEISDLLNQLILVCRRDRYVAIFLSDKSQAARLFRRPRRREDQAALPDLEPIPAGVLNAAFARGVARTLWLSGIHTRTTVKPDSKILTGVDLRDALDPLGDQTYYFTAARCLTELDGETTPVGVSPRRSRVWAGMTRSWDDFRDDVSNLLRLVEQTERAKQSESAPIPVLAAPLTSPQDVRDAFDVGVLAPEMLGEGVDSETHERLEQWAYKGGFEVVPTEGPSFVAGVSLGGEALGELTFSVDLTDPERVAWDVAATPEALEDHRLREIAAISENPRWIQIRYESGHTISEGAVYGVRYRDVRFRAWQFPVLRLGGKKIDITKEKPVRPNSNVFDREAVGEQDSLFCWVARTWPEGLRGWLACDDGSMEIADFVHLASTEPPLLSLIHVKGSHSDKPARGISVSDYEVVTSQAIKNLRFLDDLIVSVGLQIGFDKRIGSLVWRDGALQADRRGMLAALGVLGSNYARRVVILQPRLTRREHDLGRAEQDKGVESGRVARLRQLDTLLVSVEASCRDLGADLLVIGDGSE